jgi:uncharacterized protein (DUF3084 family)
MAIKAEITIKIFRGAVRTYASRRVIMANSVSDVTGRLLSEAGREYSEFSRARPEGELLRTQQGSIVYQYEDGPALIRLEADILSNPNANKS